MAAGRVRGRAGIGGICRICVARVVLPAGLAGVLLTSVSALASAEDCPNASVRHGLSATLPDCRAYELLTPVDKTGAEDLFGNANSVAGANSDVGYPSHDGERFLIDTTASFGAGGVSGENSYLFSRSSDGWRMTSLAPTGLGVQSLAPEIYDPLDFSEVGVSDRVGSEADPSAERLMDLVGPPGGPYTTVESSLHSQPAEMVGASSDLSHVILESANHELAPGDTGQDTGTRALYEDIGGQLRLVNVNTDGSLVSPCGATLGQNPGFPGGYHDAVSSDGSKILFTAPEPNATGPGCWDGASSNPPQLYMRSNAATTVDLSAPEAGVTDPDGLQPAVYVGASADGSKVFFMTQTELTADDATHDPELYEYNTDASTKPLTRISRGVSGNADGNVRFVPAVSSDGSTVYFAADGQLAPGAPTVSGQQVNLYRYDTNSETTTYIATVSEEDYPSTAAAKWYPEAYPDEVGLAINANWYTTPDGRFLLFASTQDLTGYDTTAAAVANCPDFNRGSGGNGHCYEIYRYDAATNATVCVSCNPSGAAPTANARFDRSALRADNPAGTTPRPLSDDGSFAFFDSADTLTGQAGSDVIHVYEFHNGTISLISAPGDPDDSFFLGSDANGANVFLGTHAQLLPQDTDGSGDLYDARIDGGFPQPATAPCTGDCQDVPLTPPSFATPATLTLNGGDNLPAPAAAPVRPAPKPLSRAQKLASALRACRAKRDRHRRHLCESTARHRYGTAARATTINSKGHR